MKQLTRSAQAVCALTLSTLMLTACGPALIAGAAGGAKVLHDRRTTGTMVEDQAIELKAANLLRQNPQLRENARIKFVSYDNNLLIIGQVPSQNASDQIENLARNVDKVQKIYNELEIGAPKSIMTSSSDAWLTTKAKAAAVADKNIDPLHVKVISENGVVYLMGLVTREEADAATECVREMDGVQRVVRAFEYLD